MRKKFETRLEAIDWMADHAKNKGQFEVCREHLLFNQIYTGTFYLEIAEKEEPENVVLLNDSES